VDTNRALLLIADIGGYTEYMRGHRTILGHAEAATTRLLGKVVDAARSFDLIEIEGDAAFLSRDADKLDDAAARALIADVAVAMHRAFHEERQLVERNLCPCDSCAQTSGLKLKFVAHVGEVAQQKIRRQRKLVGVDVIYVHRLLKNPVQIPEYVLFSEELYGGGDGPSADDVAHAVSQELEGIGSVQAFYVDVGDLPGSEEPLSDPSFGRRVGATFSILGGGFRSKFRRASASSRDEATPSPAEKLAG